MSTTINATAANWLAALAEVAPAIASRPPVPALSAVLLTPLAVDSVLVSATDYETSARVNLLGAYTLTDQDPFLAPHRPLVDIIKTITGKKTTALITVRHEGDDIVVEGNGYSIPVQWSIPIDEYPALPELPTRVAFAPTEKVKELFAHADVAVSDDETLPILTGFRVELEGQGMTVLATDRYRLVSDYLQVENPTGTATAFLVSAKRWKAAARHLKGSHLGIGYDEKNRVIRVSDDNVEYTFTAIDGDYPKIAGLFPDDVVNSVTADVKTLLESAQVAVKLTERNVPCYLTLHRDGATITKGNSDGSKRDAGAPLAAGNMLLGTPSELPIKVGFNPHYLVELLKAIPTCKVTISMNTLPKPWLFTPEDVSPSDPTGHRHLLMPVRLAT